MPWTDILDRPVVFFDLETTSLDVTEGRIVEMAFAIIEPHEQWPHTYSTARFNPGVSISPDATAAHGITDADVHDCPPFSSVAERVASLFRRYDIGGYNVRAYDLPLLDEELRRCGYKLDVTGKRIFDASVIFRKKEGRTLTDAVRKYCDPVFASQFTDAHSAKADTIATVRVFGEQLERHYQDLAEMSQDDLSAFCEYSKTVDLAGKLKLNDHGVICFAFGKHQDKPVMSEPGYVQWMLRSNFPGSTVDVLLSLMNKEA